MKAMLFATLALIIAPFAQAEKLVELKIKRFGVEKVEQNGPCKISTMAGRDDGQVRIEITRVYCKADWKIGEEPFGQGHAYYYTTLISKSGLRVTRKAPVIYGGRSVERLATKLKQATSSCPVTLTVDGDGELRGSEFKCSRFSELPQDEEAFVIDAT
jgi:hypothetical protein